MIYNGLLNCLESHKCFHDIYQCHFGTIFFSKLNFCAFAFCPACTMSMFGLLIPILITQLRKSMILSLNVFFIELVSVSHFPMACRFFALLVLVHVVPVHDWEKSESFSNSRMENLGRELNKCTEIADNRGNNTDRFLCVGISGKLQTGEISVAQQ